METIVERTINILIFIFIIYLMALLFMFQLQINRIIKEDVNRDGVVDIKDLLIVQKKILEENGEL